MSRIELILTRNAAAEVAIAIIENARADGTMPDAEEAGVDYKSSRSSKKLCVFLPYKARINQKPQKEQIKNHLCSQAYYQTVSNLFFIINGSLDN